MQTVAFQSSVDSVGLAIDDERQRAWSYYRAVLRGRDGRDYEELEPTVWAELRLELAGLDERTAVRR